MPRSVNTIRSDLTGGMGRHRRPGNTQAYLLQNARPEADGTAVVRLGQVLHTTAGSASSGSIQALFGQKSDGMSRVYSVKREDGVNDKIYDGNTELTGGSSFGASALSTSINEYNGWMFFSNGESTLQVHEIGTLVRSDAVAGQGALHEGRHNVIYKDRMYTMDDANLWWTQAGVFLDNPAGTGGVGANGMQYHADNNIIIGDDGDDPTGMIPTAEQLVVFKPNSFHIMRGEPDDDGSTGDMFWFSFYSIGCNATRGITATKRGVVFLGSDGRIYLLQGATLIDLDPLDHITPYLVALSPDALKWVSVHVHKDEIWVSLPTIATEDGATSDVLVYNTHRKNWCVFTEINGYAYTSIDEDGSLFVGSADSGKIYHQNAGETDEGTKPPLAFISNKETINDPRHFKVFDLVVAQIDMIDSDELSFSYIADGVAGDFAKGTPHTSTGFAPATWEDEDWGESTWGGIGPNNIFLRFANGSGIRAREFQLLISGNVRSGTRLNHYGFTTRPDGREDEVI